MGFASLEQPEGVTFPHWEMLTVQVLKRNISSFMLEQLNQKWVTLRPFGEQRGCRAICEGVAYVVQGVQLDASSAGALHQSLQALRHHEDTELIDIMQLLVTKPMQACHQSQILPQVIPFS